MIDSERMLIYKQDTGDNIASGKVDNNESSVLSL